MPTMNRINFFLPVWPSQETLENHLVPIFRQHDISGFTATGTKFFMGGELPLGMIFTALVPFYRDALLPHNVALDLAEALNLQFVTYTVEPVTADTVVRATVEVPNHG